MKLPRQTTPILRLWIQRARVAQRAILAWALRGCLDRDHLLGLLLGWRERLGDRLGAHVAAGGPLVMLLGNGGGRLSLFASATAKQCNTVTSGPGSCPGIAASTTSVGDLFPPPARFRPCTFSPQFWRSPARHSIREGRFPAALRAMARMCRRRFDGRRRRAGLALLHCWRTIATRPGARLRTGRCGTFLRRGARFRRALDGGGRDATTAARSGTPVLARHRGRSTVTCSRSSPSTASSRFHVAHRRRA
jgi:hypothetical protein